VNRKNLSLKLIKLLAILHVLWISFCFAYSAYLYKTKPIFGPTNLERVAYGYKNDQSNLDSVDIRISKIVEGDFFGSARVFLRDEQTLKDYKKSNDAYLLINGVHAAEFLPQLHRFHDLKLSKKLGTSISLENVDAVEIYDRGSDTNYPFDEYHIGLSFELGISSPNSNEISYKTPKSATVLFDLPRNYMITKLDQIPSFSCQNRECENKFIAPVKDNEFLVKVSRTRWLQWFVLGLMSVVFAPLILLLNAKVESINVDILASLLSIMAIRVLLLGATTKFYTIDFAFGLAALLTVIVPLIKIQFISSNEQAVK